MRSISLFCLIFGLLSSCGSDAKPVWAVTFHAPAMAGSKCYIGSSSDKVSRELALSSAYENALTNIVKGEVPELVRISEKTTENLKSADYDRQTTVRSNLVKFSMLTEHAQSPYIEPEPTGQYSAVRVYCWAAVAITAERKRLESNNFEEPTKPVHQIVPEAPRKIIIFKSMPLGATVEIDGITICTTPCAEAVTLGQHFMVLSKTDLEPTMKSIDINAESRAIFGELKSKGRW